MLISLDPRAVHHIIYVPKAKNAKKFGTKVINEAQLVAYIKKGEFPAVQA